jgi:hypothetical protein
MDAAEALVMFAALAGSGFAFGRAVGYLLRALGVALD